MCHVVESLQYICLSLLLEPKLVEDRDNDIIIDFEITRRILQMFYETKYPKFQPNITRRRDSLLSRDL